MPCDFAVCRADLCHAAFPAVVRALNGVCGKPVRHAGDGDRRRQSDRLEHRGGCRRGRWCRLDGQHQYSPAASRLSSSLAQLQASNANVTVNITGNSQTINGASAFQGIQVSGANAPTVNISSLSLTNTAALGGAGQNGQNGYYSGGLSYGSGGGGGGGLGAGGGLLVGSGANVTLAAVTFTGNTATGGTGGNWRQRAEHGGRSGQRRQRRRRRRGEQWRRQRWRRRRWHRRTRRRPRHDRHRGSRARRRRRRRRRLRHHQQHGLHSEQQRRLRQRQWRQWRSRRRRRHQQQRQPGSRLGRRLRR